ncbi:MAG: bifunctional precorrin-2 dehydrogenase/sirohydrochlorin ferrochelatase [Chloroflexota bacterium]|nr:bifunctional precorrin-2 dehydrogenase/sirohydrochlorin ferrochelatase [Chloroflexota bacterium]
MAQRTATNKHYPVFLTVEGRRCVVIGGGTIAERKVEGLLDAGAEVTVVTPECTAGVRALADAGEVALVERAYEPGDLAGAFIAIAATDDSDVNEAVSREAAERNVPLNVVDVTHLCTFIAPSIVRRGPVTLAMSTGGLAPALARKLRESLEANDALAFADLAEMTARVRADLRGRSVTVDPEGWQASLNSEVLELFQSGERERAEARLTELLESWPYWVKAVAP